MGADFTRPLALPAAVAGLRRTAFFPGSSIGNFEPQEAARLLRGIAALLGEDGRLLIGVDLKKDPARLHAAYNDARGITAQFNLNLLERIRTELEGELDPAGFRHHAFYNERLGRIEMHLVSACEQTVRVAGVEFRFAAGESVRTECSYKYTARGFGRLAARAGFRAVATWTDERRWFSVQHLEC